MKIFLDTIDLEEISFFKEVGIVDGVTTNPSLMADTKQGFIETVKSICEIMPGPVSVEVIATEYEEMLKEALYVAEVAENIVVKLPLTSNGLRVCKDLSLRQIKTNVTLCFSGTQALLAAKAGATYVSPFVGRLDDICISGIKLIDEIKRIFNNYNIGTEILAASIRNSKTVLEVAMIGADVVTVPSKVLREMLEHPLTNIGLEKFLKDWQRGGLNF